MNLSLRVLNSYGKELFEVGVKYNICMYITVC
jgi:hypothetical protein